MENSAAEKDEWDKIMDEYDEFVVSPEMVEVFVAAIGDEPFVLADLADKLNIGPAEALATFDYIQNEGLLQFQCTWTAIRKGDPLWIENDHLKRRMPMHD
ncbi:MAG: hypothetical protein JWR50_4273 [Mucilaginibacter sp.]|nr:hypothetical protein [Mucilaginibacter sp.]